MAVAVAVAVVVAAGAAVVDEVNERRRAVDRAHNRFTAMTLVLGLLGMFKLVDGNPFPVIGAGVLVGLLIVDKNDLWPVARGILQIVLPFFIFVGRALTAPSYSSGFRPHYGDAGGLAAGPSIQLALSLVGQLVFFAQLVGFFVFGILDIVNASRIRGALPSSEQH